jgi:hypothetical protein
MHLFFVAAGLLSLFCPRQAADTSHNPKAFVKRAPAEKFARIKLELVARSPSVSASLHIYILCSLSARVAV